MRDMSQYEVPINPSPPLTSSEMVPVLSKFGDPHLMAPGLFASHRLFSHEPFLEPAVAHGSSLDGLSLSFPETTEWSTSDFFFGWTGGRSRRRTGIYLQLPRRSERFSMEPSALLAPGRR